MALPQSDKGTEVYKRKVICSTHNGPSLHPLTGEVLYVLTESAVLRDSLPRRQECMDCGDKRRDEEEKKKQDRLKRLFAEDERD